eukprot:GAHX01000546.1.p1 GENE.GAHX01000546.1~~GAHX01000546.1.p1  ORF type:complete len:619 (-),score=118.17 GAHX01000546.1:27-1883(-)
MEELRVYQYFIVTGNGEPVTYHKLTGELGKETISIFNSKFIGKTPSSVFSQDGVTYFWVRNDLFYYVITTLSKCSPLVASDFLDSSIAIFKDYLGSLTENSHRSNFFLIYELLAEICTFGFIQESHNKTLKAHVVGKPVSTDGPGVIDQIRDRFNTGSRSSGSANRSILTSRLDLLTGSNYTNAALEAPTNIMNTIRGMNSFGPALDGKQTMPSRSLFSSSTGFNLGNLGSLSNEIFLDVYETLECIFDRHGNSVINRLVGQVYARSFLFQPVHCKVSYTPLKVLSLSDIKESDIEETTSFNNFNISSTSDVAQQPGFGMSKPRPKQSMFSGLNNLNFGSRANSYQMEASQDRNVQFRNTSPLFEKSKPGLMGNLASVGNVVTYTNNSAVKTVSEIEVNNAYTKLISNPHQADKTILPLSGFGRGVFEFDVPEGEHLLFEYTIDNTDEKRNNFEAPISVTSSLDFNKNSPSTINLITILSCNLPDKQMVTNVEMGILLPPTKLITGVSCRYMEANEKYSFDYFEEERRISWKIKNIKGGGKDVAKFIISLNLPKETDIAIQKTDLIIKNFPPAMLNFDCNGGLPTGFKIDGLTTGKGTDVKKWVRYHTICGTYEKRLS